MMIAAGVAAVLASCGSGDDDRLSPTSPGQTNPTAPSTTPEKTAQPSGPAKPRDEKGSGGTSAPSGRSGERTPQEAQRDFEKYCETHPGACGD
jgi:hypothetical protein